MRAYTKPIMRLERFTAKNAVATGCYEEEHVTIPQQTVNCIINGSETTFTQGTCGSVGLGATGIYDGQYIYVWYNGSIQGRPSAEQTAILSAMGAAVGWNISGQSGYHAGYISEETYKEMNSTS